MLRVFSQSALTLTAVLTAVMLLMRVYVGVTTPAPPTFDLFTYPGCEGPCWHGLEIGKSGPDDLEPVLTALNVTRIEVHGYRVSPFETGTVALVDEYAAQISNFFVESTRYRNRADGYNARPNFWDGQLHGIEVIADVCPVEILLTYGVPDRTYILSAKSVYMMYEVDGVYLWFTVDRRRPPFMPTHSIASGLVMGNWDSRVRGYVHPRPLEPVGWAGAAGAVRQLPCEAD